MPTQAERTALMFLAGVTVAGATVRVAKAVQHGEKPPPAAAGALQQQRRAVDSALMIRQMRPPPAAARPARIVKPKPPAVRYPIDVDRADSATLDVLPGVGPALAARIVAVRDSAGPFGSLTRFAALVRGVGPVMTGRIDSLVTFSGQPR